jgi:hypothetical protein
VNISGKDVIAHDFLLSPKFERKFAAEGIQHSSLSILTRLRAEWLRNHGSVFGGGKRCFSSSQRLSRLYPIQWYAGLFPPAVKRPLAFICCGSIFFPHGVRLSPVGTAATVWPIVPAPDDR